MSFLVLLIKALPYLLPFVREMVMGKKSWGQAFRDHRSKTILTLFVLFSVVFNTLLMYKVTRLAYRYVELSHAYRDLEKKNQNLEKNAVGLNGSNRHPTVGNSEVMPTIPVASVKTQSLSARRNLGNSVVEEFEEIRERETREH